MRSATEAATSSALSLLQLGEAADAFGVSPIAVPALSVAQDSSTANRSPARDHPPAARRRLAKRPLPSLS